MEGFDVSAETKVDACFAVDAGDDLTDFGADGVAEQRRGDVDDGGGQGAFAGAGRDLAYWVRINRTPSRYRP